MNYYEIRDRVPCSEIDALTSEALREYLKRNNWTVAEEWEHPLGVPMVNHAKKDRDGYWQYALVSGNDKFRDHSRRMRESVESIVNADEKRVHVVIAEIRAIAEWQRRCKEWVAPKEGEACNRCWKCNDVLAMPWEAPATSFPFAPTCPTCGNKRCPRATDHRNECSGSNEAGQEGSRYA